jgi:hypothetical protein
MHLCIQIYATFKGKSAQVVWVSVKEGYTSYAGVSEGNMHKCMETHFVIVFPLLFEVM